MLSRIAPLVLLLILPGLAEDPISFGLRGAYKAFSEVPTETASKARATAAELLSRYVKAHDGNHLSKFSTGTAGRWLETKGLNLNRVTAQAVSNADQANGIAESYLVSVDAEMSRNFDPTISKWSAWHEGGNLFLPAAIKVVRGTDGRWTAHAPTLSNLVAFSARGNPGLVPTGTKSDSDAIVPLLGTPAPANRALPTVSTEAEKPQTPSPTASLAAKFAISMIRIVIVVALVVIGIPLLFLFLAKLLVRTTRPQSKSRAVAPPPTRSSAPLPPPLPKEPPYSEMDLMRANSHLLTPAEQAFHAVLEPLVRNSCAISTKVRLADLFSVIPGRGQQAAFNKISRKHIDFVLTEPTTSRILCAIELDDSSHNRADRIGRDDFVNELFAANNLPLLRVPFAWTYNLPGLRAELLKAGVVLSSAA